MLKLFRRHIGRSAGNAGCLYGHRLGFGKRVFVWRAKKLGQPKVQDLENVFRRNPQIAGLKVAMKNSSRVSRRQPAGQLHSQ